MHAVMGAAGLLVAPRSSVLDERDGRYCCRFTRAKSTISVKDLLL